MYQNVVDGRRLGFRFLMRHGNPTIDHYLDSADLQEGSRCHL